LFSATKGISAILANFPPLIIEDKEFNFDGKIYTQTLQNENSTISLRRFYDADFVV